MKGIPITRDKPIGLIKRWKAGLKNLLVSTCIKRRTKEEAVRNYLKSERQKSLHPFNVAPTSHYWGPYSRIEDYGLKENIRP
jgi:hypothetical protein